MEELSLKDLLTIVWKGRWLISVITIAAIFLGLFYCLVIMDDVYQADAVLMVSPVGNEENVGDIDSISKVINYVSKDPVLTMETFLHQVTAMPVLSKAADELNLDEEYASPVEALKNMISVDTPEDTNLIYISVKNSDKEKASLIAKTTAEKYIDYISDNLLAQANKSVEFVSDQYEVEKTNVSNAMGKLTEFLAQPRGISELEGELSNNLSQIKSFKAQLTQLDIDIAYTTAVLNAAEDKLDDTPKTIDTIKAVGDEQILSEVLKENSSKNYSDIAELTMVEQHLNPVYTSLISEIKNYEIALAKYNAQYESMNIAILNLQKKVETLQAEIANKKNDYEILQDEVNLAKSARDLYQGELKAIETKLLADIGESTVIMIADGSITEEVTQSKAVVMIITAVLGAMLGVFIVFIRRMWQED